MAHSITEPTFTGHIHDTLDALIVFECVLRGWMDRVPRRLRDDERHLIRSGSVFVFSERQTGVKRWTDGLHWSPSRIWNNFLLYRQIEDRNRQRGPDAQASASGSIDSGRSIDPMAQGVSYTPQSSLSTARPGTAQSSDFTDPSWDAARMRSISDAAVVGSSRRPFDPRDPAGPRSAEVGYSSGYGPGASQDQALLTAMERREAESNREFYGSLDKGNYPFVKDGLMKKNITVPYDGTIFHLVSYYKKDDARLGRLRRPSSLPEFANLTFSAALVRPENFRQAPRLEALPDGSIRYLGETADTTRRPAGTGSGSDGTSGSDGRSLQAWQSPSIGALSPGLGVESLYSSAPGPSSLYDAQQYPSFVSSRPARSISNASARPQRSGSGRYEPYNTLAGASSRNLMGPPSFEYPGSEGSSASSMWLSQQDPSAPFLAKQGRWGAGREGDLTSPSYASSETNNLAAFGGGSHSNGMPNPENGTAWVPTGAVSTVNDPVFSYGPPLDESGRSRLAPAGSMGWPQGNQSSNDFNPVSSVSGINQSATFRTEDLKSPSSAHSQQGLGGYASQQTMPTHPAYQQHFANRLNVPGSGSGVHHGYAADNTSHPSASAPASSSGAQFRVPEGSGFSAHQQQQQQMLTGQLQHHGEYTVSPQAQPQQLQQSPWPAYSTISPGGSESRPSSTPSNPSNSTLGLMSGAVPIPIPWQSSQGQGQSQLPSGHSQEQGQAMGMPTSIGSAPASSSGSFGSVLNHSRQQQQQQQQQQTSYSPSNRATDVEALKRQLHTTGRMATFGELQYPSGSYHASNSQPSYSTTTSGSGGSSSGGGGSLAPVLLRRLPDRLVRPDSAGPGSTSGSASGSASASGDVNVPAESSPAQGGGIRLQQ